jgi:hypothetical protein
LILKRCSLWLSDHFLLLVLIPPIGPLALGWESSFVLVVALVAVVQAAALVVVAVGVTRLPLLVTPLSLSGTMVVVAPTLSLLLVETLLRSLDWGGTRRNRSLY